MEIMFKPAKWIIAAMYLAMGDAAIAAEETHGVTATEIKIGATFPFSGPGAFMSKYLPGASVSDGNYIFGMIQGQVLEQLLKQAGNDLTRENIAKQARDIRNFAPGMLLPGITIDTDANKSQSIAQLQLQRWNGTTYERFGGILSATSN